MYNLDKAYSKNFFRQRKRLAWRVPIFCDAVMNVLKPTSVVDLGCGNGDLIRGFLDRGLEHCLGVEGSTGCFSEAVIPSDRLLQWDLREPGLRSVISLTPHLFFPLNMCLKVAKHIETRMSFSLAMCLEVAEHIEQKYSHILVENLTSVSDRLLFSAAGKCQGGRYHVNCQDKKYWINLFREHFFEYKPEVVARLLNILSTYRNKKGIKAFYQNMMYFKLNAPF